MVAPQAHDIGDLEGAQAMNGKGAIGTGQVVVVGKEQGVLTIKAT